MTRHTALRGPGSIYISSIIPRKSLSARTHVCPHCGLVLDRDENAALNIQWRGQRLRGVAGLPAALNREPAAL